MSNTRSKPRTPSDALVAVQMVNYHTRDYLQAALATVVADLDRSGITYEIKLLDNASGEPLSDIAARYEHASALSAERNLGFGAGHNLLAATTTASYLLILNPDVRFTSDDTCARLLCTIERDASIAAVGPKLVNPTGAPQPYDHGRLHGLRAQISYRAGHSYWRATDRAQLVAWVSGAAMLVRREAYAAVGGFDERYFLYKEDEDLCLRLRRRGGEIAYDPSVVVLHEGSVVAARGEELAESTRLFIETHYGRSDIRRRALERLHFWLPYLGW